MKTLSILFLPLIFFACQTNQIIKKKPIMVDSNYFQWKTTQVGAFQIKLPPDYQIVSYQDSLELKKDKEVIKIKSQWMLEWNFVPKLMMQVINNQMVKGNSNFKINADSIEKIYPNYFIIKQKQSQLDLEIAYPRNAQDGFTEILGKNPQNQQAISLSGENLSGTSIQNILKIAQSIHYQPIRLIYVSQIKKDLCDDKMTREELVEYRKNIAFYETPRKIYKISQLPNNQIVIKLKLYRNCCEELSFNIIEKEKKLFLTSEVINRTSIYYYDKKYGVVRDYEICLCDCVNCYQLTIQGIQNYQGYTFYYQPEDSSKAYELKVEE